MLSTHSHSAPTLDRLQYIAGQHGATLRSIAQRSIQHGLPTGQKLILDPDEFDAELFIPCATFVTLNRQGALRGCIGSLEAHRPLAEDIAHNAFAAAFHDPRFVPLTQHEYSDLEIHLSLLSARVAMSFSTEQDLLEQIEAGKDGLILEAPGHRGTFLPSVWQSLPDKVSFLNHLKQKAGLSSRYWSDQIKISRYHTISI